MPTEFSDRIASVVASIPPGKVASYGQVASAAGNPRAARQVVRILRAWSRSKGLPWHRVVNREGHISLPPGAGRELQQALLEDEGVEVSADGRVDMRRYGVGEELGSL